MKKELTWRSAIEKVLAASAAPLHYADIADKIISEGLRKNIGATPAATVNAQIAASIKHDGSASPYIRVSKGIFALKKGSNPESIVMPKLTPEVSESTEAEEQYDIVTSFGMYWSRDVINWSSNTKLLGMQKKGATPVDLSKQLGIYLLYDGREVIYAGRTTDSSLGKRLFDHTNDRLSSRWDRFSWFGLLPISESGQIGALPDSYPAAKLIPAFEAVLIEALEPRQNRKRGDDLSSVEFLQVIDPEIEKRRVKALIDKL